MRAALKAYGDLQRKVWVADSFKGVPPPDAENYYLDKDDRLHRFEQLAVSVERGEGEFHPLRLARRSSAVPSRLV